MSARYLLRGLLGIVLAAAAVVIAASTIYHLVRTGSCASGGPYLSARPCPSGSGLRVLALIGSIFVLAPISIFVFGSRAKGTDGVPSMAGLIGLLWTISWIAMGTAAWVAGHGPAKPVSGGEGSTGVAITFWAIGGVSLLFVILGLGAGGMSARARERSVAAGAGPRPVPPPPRPAPAPVAAPPVDDTARRLKQLDELRALGAITDAEHEAKRREILGSI
jgi:hypothetical protein